MQKKQKKRILYQATHRGCKEGDIILGEFGKDNINNLSQEELDSFEVLLKLDDEKILNWIMKKNEALPEFKIIIGKIKEFSGL